MSKLSEFKYIHAINILAAAKIDALQNIEAVFNGDWEKAWRADLTKYIPRDRDENGKLKGVDYQELKRKIDPDREWAYLARAGINLLTINDKHYPQPLKHIAHPPHLLYLRGAKEILQSSCFAVVGTRALSEYGRRATPHITQELARAGFTIVSGLATGVDTLAHKAALDEGGKTIAVLGCGPDDSTIFPQQNLKLAHKIIATGGVVISEYAPGSHGSKFTFPQRNRIISGLSKGVLVVEADIQSGALITAHAAVEQNRDLFCVPGSIFAKTSQGSNYMIQKGAKLVMSAQDVLEEYGIELAKSEREIKAENETEAKILAVLASEPVMIDDIIRKTGLATAQVNATLVLMELNRKVKNLGANRFVLYN